MQLTVDKWYKMLFPNSQSRGISLLRLELKMIRFALSVAILASSALMAAPVGNTAAPQMLQDGFFIPSECWIDLRAGYEGDFVADARMKQRKEGHGRVDDDSQSTNSATVTINLLDRLDMYGVFGSSRTSAQWRFLDASGAVHNAEMETFHNFLWGVGARAILFEWCHCDLGLGGRYSSVNNKPLWLTIDGTNAPVSGTHCRWSEWQVNIDISYHIEILTPYIGVKYSSARTHLGTFTTAIASNGSGNNHFKNRDSVGLFVGCGFSTGKYFMLNVEGRLIDEEAVTISGDLRF